MNNPILEVAASSNGQLINETIASASFAQLKAAYRELLASGTHPNVIRLLEAAIKAREQIVKE